VAAPARGGAHRCAIRCGSSAASSPRR
jgi:hypothetical protein